MSLLKRWRRLVLEKNFFLRSKALKRSFFTVELMYWRHVLLWFIFEGWLQWSDQFWILLKWFSMILLWRDFEYWTRLLICLKTDQVWPLHPTKWTSNHYNCEIIINITVLGVNGDEIVKRASLNLKRFHFKCLLLIKRQISTLTKFPSRFPNTCAI